MRLAAVVLMVKVSAGYSTRITAKELGRWIGLRPSRAAHLLIASRAASGARDHVRRCLGPGSRAVGAEGAARLSLSWTRYWA
ncbi:hypothetical protein GCM10010236_74940 [Streptomyces eurythermus]|nr:hypothetical protein GCM10010236_74940 [Streptomyces eurythermus]